MKTYEYEGILPPSLFISPKTGKKYIVPTWIEVESDTTLEQIKWIRNKTKNK